MPPRKRLLSYILLNVLISALTTLLVLWIWDQPHRQSDQSAHLASAQATVDAMAGSPAAEIPASTEDAPEEIQIEIENIFGAGNLNSEVAVIKNKSGGSLTLTGWRLENGRGNGYTFPNLVLNSGGAVQLHSSAGADSVIDLYWGQDAPVWQAGDTASLLDGQGTVRATHEIR
ncbi:MAG: lamin tail domain-containing protein [Anaerolineaceae bacterium]